MRENFKSEPPFEKANGSIKALIKLLKSPLKFESAIIARLKTSNIANIGACVCVCTSECKCACMCERVCLSVCMRWRVNSFSEMESGT